MTTEAMENWRTQFVTSKLDVANYDVQLCLRTQIATLKRGVASIHFVTTGFNPLCETVIINQRAVGSTHKKPTNNGQYLPSDLSSNRICGKIQKGCYK